MLAFGTQDELNEALGFYPVDAADSMRVDAINAIGFGVAIMVSAFSPDVGLLGEQIKWRWLFVKFQLFGS